MYTRFRVQNYRCFQDLTLRNLTRVNLIGGGNNAGKTSLLEALFIYDGIFNPELLLRVNAMRGLSSMHIPLSSNDSQQIAQGMWVDTLFRDGDTTRIILLEGAHTGEGEERISIGLEERPVVELMPVPGTATQQAETLRALRVTNSQGELLPSIGLQSDKLVGKPRKAHHESYFFSFSSLEANEVLADRFSKLIMGGHKKAFLSALQIIEARLDDVSILQVNGQPILHGSIPGQALRPLNTMGQGMMRLVQLLTALYIARGGLVLIDEIETGFHHSVQQAIMQALDVASKTVNAQVFASTHSLELIQAAHAAFAASDDPAALSYYRLDSVDGKQRAVRYAETSIGEVLEMDVEVR